MAVDVEVEGFGRWIRGKFCKVTHRTNHGEYGQRWRTVDEYSVELENSGQRSRVAQITASFMVDKAEPASVRLRN